MRGQRGGLLPLSETPQARLYAAAGSERDPTGRSVFGLPETDGRRWWPPCLIGRRGGGSRQSGRRDKWCNEKETSTF